MVSVLVLSAVDHWWCNGERARLECCRSLVVHGDECCRSLVV